jgi:hypothetical protein
MGAFRCYLRVVSTDLQPDEITEALGVAPDEATAKGSIRRGGTLRQFTSWKRYVTVTAEAGGRPEDFEPVILGWGDQFAQALGALAQNPSVDVSLELVQEIRDIESAQEKGIYFGPDLMAWLAKARAGLDIDQYIYHECSE